MIGRPPVQIGTEPIALINPVDAGLLRLIHEYNAPFAPGSGPAPRRTGRHAGDPALCPMTIEAGGAGHETACPVARARHESTH
jgi:hypothetical protein